MTPRKNEEPEELTEAPAEEPQPDAVPEPIELAEGYHVILYGKRYVLSMPGYYTQRDASGNETTTPTVQFTPYDPEPVQFQQPS